MADCCNTWGRVTPGGIPYTVHEAACRALYEIPVVVHDAIMDAVIDWDRARDELSDDTVAS